jgi:hypothetical protein
MVLAAMMLWSPIVDLLGGYGVVILSFLGGFYSGAVHILSAPLIAILFFLIRRYDYRRKSVSIVGDRSSLAKKLVVYTIVISVTLVLVFLKYNVPLQSGGVWVFPAEKDSPSNIYKFIVVVDNFQLVYSFALLFASTSMILGAYKRSFEWEFLSVFVATNAFFWIDLLKNVWDLWTTGALGERISPIANVGFLVELMFFLLGGLLSTVVLWNHVNDILRGSTSRIVITGVVGVMGSVFPQVLGWMIVAFDQFAAAVFSYPRLFLLFGTRFTKYTGAALFGSIVSPAASVRLRKHTTLVLVTCATCMIAAVILLLPEAVRAFCPYEPKEALPALILSPSQPANGDRGVDIMIDFLNPCDFPISISYINITIVSWKDSAGKQYASGVVLYIPGPSEPVLSHSPKGFVAVMRVEEGDIVWLNMDVDIQTREFGMISANIETPVMGR